MEKQEFVDRFVARMIDRHPVAHDASIEPYAIEAANVYWGSDWGQEVGPEDSADEVLSHLI